MLVYTRRMLLAFITTHRDQIIARTREKVASRLTPQPTEIEMAHGVPLFLDQLSARLRQDFEPAGESQIGTSATVHGGELLRAGLTVGQVVRDYGNICQAITELAVEQGPQMTNEDFRTLNLCLDIAIAEAVSEYTRQREEVIVGQGMEHLGFLAHELRNLLNTATLAFDAVRSGSVGIGGSTGALVTKSLVGMSDLVTRSLAEVRIAAGPPLRQKIEIASLLEEIEIAATLHGKSREVRLSIEPASAGLMVEGDSQILASVVTNLVQNALKFTRSHGAITVRTRTTPDRVFIDVADECGGLPTGTAEKLFLPFEQRGENRTGLGLGLAISKKGALALGGDVTVRNIPGTGCVFTVDLRRASAS